MMMFSKEIKKALKQQAVRIDIDGCIGSGFLFAPENGDYIYIFTVMHVVKDLILKNKISNMSIMFGNEEYRCDPDTIECCVIPECAELSIKEIEYTHREAVVIRCLRNNINEDLNHSDINIWLGEEKLIEDGEFVGYGFPNGKRDPLELTGHLCSVHESDDKLLAFQTELGYGSDLDEIIEGYSGCALCMIYDDTPVIVGMVLKCDEGEKNGYFKGVAFSEVIRAMEERGWDILVEYDHQTVPECFLCEKIFNIMFDHTKYFSKEIQKYIRDQFFEIGNECSPSEIALREEIYLIPKCPRKREACHIYWEGKMWHLFVCKLVKQSNSSFSKDDNVDIAYICSEGDGNADIGTVVASAVRNHVLGEKIKGNCILLWQSEKNPPELRIFPKTQFGRIIENICDGDWETKKAGYHLLKGDVKQREYAIVHRSELTSSLIRCNSKDEIANKIEEVLHNVWK